MYAGKILIKCDFPTCRKEFKDLESWSNHYSGHFGSAAMTWQSLAASGRDKMLQAVKYAPEAIHKGMMIRDSNVLIGSRLVDFVGAGPELGEYALIDVTIGTGHEPKVKKLRHSAKYLRRTSRLFGPAVKIVRLFIVTESGVVEVPEFPDPPKEVTREEKAP